MRIGLVGCGRISQKHFEAIKGLQGIQAAGCCDTVKGKAKSAAEKYGIPYWTTDYESLLKKEDIDLISICTPSGLHPEQGIKAADYGKHVITEKPMGVRLTDADKLIKACNRNKVRLFVVLQNRLNSSIQMIKRAIDNGHFGKLFMIDAKVFWSRPQEYYDQSVWRGTRALDGGVFCNQALHHVDIVQWFGGSVQSVMTQTATLGRNIEAEDTGASILKFHSGCIAAISVTMLTYPKNLEGSITIIGEKGTVRVGGTGLDKILHWKFSDYDEEQAVKAVYSCPDSVYGYRIYYETVVNSIVNEEISLVDGDEGRKSVELIEAMYLSDREQKPVIL